MIIHYWKLLVVNMGWVKKKTHSTYNLSGIDVIISFPCECISELNMHFGLHMKAIPDVMSLPSTAS